MRRDPVHEAMKGVVRVYARGFNESEVRSILDPRFVAPEEWVASGFFYPLQGKEGYILTNSHVVRNAHQLEIMSILTSDELFSVETVGFVSSLEPDVALVRLPPKELRRFLKIAKIKKLPYLRVARPLRAHRGQEVKAIGYPLGMAEPNISGGEISNFISGNDEIMERWVTDAAINPGNSGGPSVTLKGEVIGINTAMVVPAENIGFITPIYFVDTVVDELLKKGETTSSHLGATLQKNSEQNRKYLEMKSTEGVIVREVFPGSLADKIGLRPRDVILSINNCAIDRHGNVQIERGFRKKNLYDVLHSTRRSKPIALGIHRDGKRLTLKAPQVAWDRGYFPMQPIVSRRRFVYFCGMVVQELSDEIISALSSVIEYDELRAYKEFTIRYRKVIVTHIGSGSRAEEMGISLGDLIVQVRGAEVQKLEDLEKLLHEAKSSNEVQFVIEFASGAFAVIDVSSYTDEDAKIKTISSTTLKAHT